MPEKHVSFKNKKSKKPSKVSQVTDSLDLTWEGTRANRSITRFSLHSSKVAQV